MTRTAPLLFASLLAFAAIEAAVFHSRIYLWLISPDSSTGYVETRLYNEAQRPKEGPQILAIGDSRMVLSLRIANGLAAETGYTFGNIATAGATPRAWYYMLRDADPTANRYRAVVIAVESYDDADEWEDLADWEADLNYLVAHLRLSDLWEFSRSHSDPRLQWRAARGILLKGLVYKRDFEDFLLHPRARIRYVRQSRRDSHLWQFNYLPPEHDLTGFRLDWEARKLEAPANTDPARVQGLKRRLIDPLPPQTGRRSVYLKYWFGKIYERYRGSSTRLVFFRLPRGAWVRPDQPPHNPHGAVRELASQPNVTLIDERFFVVLETPELFYDEVHLNARGAVRFSEMLAREAGRILSPPR